MSTIKTDAPSTGKTIPLIIEAVSEDPDNPSVVCEANDFAVPLREEGEGVIIEIIDEEERQIVPGESLFITPLTVNNSSNTPAYVTVEIQDGAAKYPYVSDVYIPGKDTVQIGINGFSLVKAVSESDNIGGGSYFGLPGPKLLIWAKSLDPAVTTELTAVAVISEAEAGTHAPAFTGIF